MASKPDEKQRGDASKMRDLELGPRRQVEMGKGEAASLVQIFDAS